MKPTPDRPAAPSTVEFDVQFSRGPKGKQRVRAAAVPNAEPVPDPVLAPRPAAVVASVPHVVSPAPAPGPTGERVSKITLLLVLGHYFERLVRSGAVKDYAEIARMTGLTRARVTQIVDLTLLAPEIQSQMLLGSSGSHPSEACLRTLPRNWEEK